jgi:hypothetical protein
VNSLKSTFVILVLAGVLYGVYITLNAPDKSATGLSQQQLAEIQPPAIDFGGAASQAPSLPAMSAPPLTPAGGTPSNIVPAVNIDTAPPASDVPAFYSAPDRNVPPLVDTNTSAGQNSPQDPPQFTTPAIETAPPASPPTTPAYEPAATAAATNTVSPTQPSAYLTSSQPNSPPSYSGGEPSSPALEAYKLKRAWQATEQHVQDGKLRDALAALSPFANNVHLTSTERQQVNLWLDALAAKVIYSAEHHLAEPYRVSGRDQKLYDVAHTFKVEPQLLLNINSASVSDPVVLVPGTVLKVIPGPFRAELSLAGGELTLFVGELYAGRFAFTVGEERPQPGTYQVRQKSREPIYYARDGRQLAANDPANPYGAWWIDLGNNASLHSTGTATTAGGPQGCISFSPQDAQDLYGILSLQSEIVIKP